MIQNSPALAPLETLMQTSHGRPMPLPPRLMRLYGEFRVPVPRSRPHVYSNFVSTLDGVVSLRTQGHAAGGDISGFSIEDRMVMGLLRAVADVVIVGSGTLAADSHSVWTPQAICPELAGPYRRLRSSIPARGPALNVVVSASGHLDLRLPVFASGQVPALILTSAVGAKRLARQKTHDSIEIRAIRRGGGELSAHAIVEAVTRTNPRARILVEGGPRLLGCFYSEGLLDEQFLTLAPQIAGREFHDGRFSLVMGTLFAPRRPLWGTLIDLRRGASHLFLRYVFPHRSPRRPRIPRRLGIPP
jgi:riboflavin biosynthesis pyrimidine reductase